MKKRSVSIRAAVVLLLAAAVSTWMVTYLRASYRSGSQETETARVASFSVNTSGIFSQELELDIAPGENAGWTVDVLNQCETAIAYTVNAVNETNNLPLTFALTYNGEQTDRTLQAGGEQKMMLTVSWLRADDNLKYMGMIDYITVTVTATQID